MVQIFAPRGARGCPQGGDADAADEPEDAPQKAPSNELAGLILLLFIDQNGLQAKPLKAKASNHRGRGEDAADKPEDAP